MILCNLLESEKSVQELQGQVDLSQSALSQQLAILRGQNLVNTRREAQSVYYSLASEEVAAVMMVLYNIYCNIDERDAGDGVRRNNCQLR